MILMLVSLVFLAFGCASLPILVEGKRPEKRIAFLPLDNFSGYREAVRQVMPIFQEELKAQGYSQVEEEKLEAFLRRYRIRQTGIISPRTATLLGKELGVDLILAGSVDLFVAPSRPQLGITLTLISAGQGNLLWSSNLSRAGEDFTRPLGVGAITSVEDLTRRLARDLLSELAEPSLSGISKPGFFEALWRRKPYVYLRKGFRLEKTDRIAVLPFHNLSAKKEAGLIVSNLFVARLLHSNQFQVASPGEVTTAMSELRLISAENMPLVSLRSLGKVLAVKAFILGTVDIYQEGVEEPGRGSQVELYARMVEAESGRLLWSSWHGARGDDSVILLDFGLIRPVVKVVDKCVAEMVASLLARTG